MCTKWSLLCHFLHSFQIYRVCSSVVDPEWFIPDPDPALIILSSRFGSRQKFRIHADPDPRYIYYLSTGIFGNYEKHLKFNQKEESINYLPFSISYYCTVLQYTQSRIHREITVLFIFSFIFCWIRIWNNNSGSGSRQKFWIHADPDPQHWFVEAKNDFLKSRDRKDRCIW